jgi:hypothetical protein
VARGQGGIENVVGIGLAVARTVDSVSVPGSWNELHRPNGMIPAGVAVPASAVAVTEGSKAMTIESGADDGWLCLTRCGHCAAAGMAGFDLANTSEDLPPDAAGSINGSRAGRRLLVGVKHEPWDAQIAHDCCPGCRRLRSSAGLSGR